MLDSDPVATYSYLATELDRLRLGYLHIVEGLTGPMAPPQGRARMIPLLRRQFKGAYIVNGGYDAVTGNGMIERGEADLVAFGVPFLANPDLPERFRRNASLNAPDHTTFYAGEEKGYIDYPRWGSG